jgi:hypothetical protein
VTKRFSSSVAKLPFLNDQEFEDEAALLLAEYSREHGEVLVPPIPIDEIVELFLELHLTFDDMQALFGVEDVHGALWVNERRVGIDQRLEPTENPAMLGRYRFTLAHEAGHWRLHRQLFKRSANQPMLLPDHVERPEYICRSSDTDPIEYQANRFASCLLMPREMVKRAWQDWRGSLEPIYLDDLEENRQAILDAEAARRGGYSSGGKSEENILFENACRPFAEIFAVSSDAMRIRLEGMKFLCRIRENMLF